MYFIKWTPVLSSFIQTQQTSICSELISWLLTVLNIQDYIYQPHKGPIQFDFNKAFIFSVRCIGVKDSLRAVPLV